MMTCLARHTSMTGMPASHKCEEGQLGKGRIKLGHGIDGGRRRSLGTFSRGSSISLVPLIRVGHIPEGRPPCSPSTLLAPAHVFPLSPAMTLLGSSTAALLTVSLAPITSTTSASSICNRQASVSLSRQTRPGQARQGQTGHHQHQIGHSDQQHSGKQEPPNRLTDKARAGRARSGRAHILATSPPIHPRQAAHPPLC